MNTDRHLGSHLQCCQGKAHTHCSSETCVLARKGIHTSCIPFARLLGKSKHASCILLQYCYWRGAHIFHPFYNIFSGMQVCCTVNCLYKLLKAKPSSHFLQPSITGLNYGLLPQQKNELCICVNVDHLNISLLLSHSPFPSPFPLHSFIFPSPLVLTSLHLPPTPARPPVKKNLRPKFSCVTFR